METDRVLLPIEVLPFDHRRNPEEGVTIKQQRPDNRLFGLHIMGQELLGVHTGYSSASANNLYSCLDVGRQPQGEFVLAGLSNRFDHVNQAALYIPGQ